MATWTSTGNGLGTASWAKVTWLFLTSIRLLTQEDSNRYNITCVKTRKHICSRGRVQRMHSISMLALVSSEKGCRSQLDPAWEKHPWQSPGARASVQNNMAVIIWGVRSFSTLLSAFVFSCDPVVFSWAFLNFLTIQDGSPHYCLDCASFSSSPTLISAYLASLASPICISTFFILAFCATLSRVTGWGEGRPSPSISFLCHSFLSFQPGGPSSVPPLQSSRHVQRQENRECGQCCCLSHRSLWNLSNMDPWTLVWRVGLGPVPLQCAHLHFRWRY